MKKKFSGYLATVLKYSFVLGATGCAIDYATTKYDQYIAPEYKFYSDRHDNLVNYFTALKPSGKRDTLPQKEILLLDKIAEDQVITEEELFDYGVSLDIIEIASKERVDSLLTIYSQVLKDKKGSPEKEKNSYIVPINQGESVNILEMLDYLKQEKKDYIIFTREYQEKEEKKDVVVYTSDLQEMQDIFLDYQSRLGLENLELELIDAKTSYAFEDEGVVGIGLDHARLNNAYPYIIGHELGHIYYSANHPALYQTAHHFLIAAKELVTRNLDYSKEDNADDVALSISPRVARSAYQYFLGDFYYEDKKDFIRYACKRMQVNEGDWHSPGTKRITKMMLNVPR